jgi:hypothetical protein
MSYCFEIARAVQWAVVFIRNFSMGMLRGVMAVGVLATLSGCGAYNDFKANNAVQDYRQNCTGTYTNECESKLVDTNIVMLELARSNLEREKDTLVKTVGKDGYERFAKAANEVIDDLIDRQEQKRPGMFARWVLGEAQPFQNTRNQLFLESDMKELITAVVKRVSETNPVAQARTKIEESLTPTAAILLGKEVQPVEASAPVVAAVQAPGAQSSVLEAAVDREIANEIAKDGGDEFKDARQILITDLNGDGTNDAVVLYTIEGQGGGNGYFQSLATFYASPGGWVHRGKVVVGQGVQNIEVIGPQTLSLKVLTVGPDDADCCPSVESIQKLTWNGSTFLQSPST